MAAEVRLPASGRRGRPPAWPLKGQAPAVWGQLWSSPQAVAWEQLGWSRVVARYALVLALSESTLKPPLLAEVRQLEDRLGLTPMAMLRLRWRVLPDDGPAAAASSPPQRRRLVVVDPQPEPESRSLDA